MLLTSKNGGSLGRSVWAFPKNARVVLLRSASVLVVSVQEDAHISYRLDRSSSDDRQLLETNIPTQVVER